MSGIEEMLTKLTKKDKESIFGLLNKNKPVAAKWQLQTITNCTEKEAKEAIEILKTEWKQQQTK